MKPPVGKEKVTDVSDHEGDDRVATTVHSTFDRSGVNPFSNVSVERTWLKPGTEVRSTVVFVVWVFGDTEYVLEDGPNKGAVEKDGGVMAEGPRIEPSVEGVEVEVIEYVDVGRSNTPDITEGIPESNSKPGQSWNPKASPAQPEPVGDVMLSWNLHPEPRTPPPPKDQLLTLLAFTLLLSPLDPTPQTPLPTNSMSSPALNEP